VVTTIRDLLPFGDIGTDLIERVASARPGLPVDELAGVFRLGKAAVGMFESIAQPLTEAGISPARWRLLMTLRHQSEPIGASISEIAGHLEIREPTVTATVDRAVKDGLVERRKDPDDRRITRVLLTTAGHETIDRIFPNVLGRLLAFSAAMGGVDAITNTAARLERAVAQTTPERTT
jgi:DNA-binding MarR family transcriptional regulator